MEIVLDCCLTDTCPKSYIVHKKNKWWKLGILTFSTKKKSFQAVVIYNANVLILTYAITN